MIITETITIRNKEFIKTYSDTYLIQKIGTNETYAEAIDILNSGFEYAETDELLPINDLSNSEMLEELGVEPNVETI